MKISIIKIQNFIAPEILNKDIGKTEYIYFDNIKEDNKYMNKCDLYSIGITMYYLYFGKFPFQLNSHTESLSNILDIKFKIEEDIQLEDLIKKLLKENPDERLNWEEYFEHPFFKQYNY